MQKIEFLGFMVTPTISMDVAKAAPVSFWLTMTNLKAVQAFLDFANFYCQFIVGLSDIVIPLIHLTCKDTPFTWCLNHTKVFEALKLPSPRHPSWCISTPIIQLLLKLMLLTM